MKKILFISVILLMGMTKIFAQAEVETDSTKLPEMIFEVTEHDFGTLQKGDPCVFDFVFKNTGKSDLVITNVKSSCGCTTPTYTKEPVAKKEEGSISVKYDSNRVGSFHKTITITSNAANSPIVLSISGKIENAPVEETSSENE